MDLSMVGTVYPYDWRQFVLIVPSMVKTNSKLLEFIFNSPLIRIWLLAIGMFTILRIIQRKVINPSEPLNQIVYIPFNTFGLSFGTTSVTGGGSRSEVIATFFLTLFGMLAGLLFSGLLFEQLTITESVQEITSFSDLTKYPNIEIVHITDVPREALIHNRNL